MSKLIVKIDYIKIAQWVKSILFLLKTGKVDLIERYINKITEHLDSAARKTKVKKCSQQR